MHTPFKSKTAAVFLASASLLMTVSSARAQQVVFTEIMYNPLDENPEFVEILNNGVTPWDMALWRIEGGVDYTFPDFSSGSPEATFMRASERLIVASVTPEELREAYPSIPDDVRIFGPWEGQLSNSGEDIALVDKNGSLRCTLDYGDDDLWSVVADGSGHSLHVVNSNLKVDDFHNWRASAEAGGSPGLPDAERTRSVVLSEVRFDENGTLAWVEVYNAGPAAVDLTGHKIGAKVNLAVQVPLSGTIEPGAYASFDVSIEGEGDTKVFLLDGDGNALDAAVFKRSTVDSHYQTFPAGSSEWFLTGADTRGAANEVVVRDEIVISEIMFAPPIGGSGEFVEIHNRSDATVDLSGWKLSEAVSFTFPPDTSIEAGRYLVVVSDQDWFGKNYAQTGSVVGEFDGGLSNDGELIRLLDSQGNLADHVDYGVGGAWPWKTDDAGSSLELIHPDMDNNLPSAWLDSDESQRTEFREYEVTLEYARTNFRNSDDEIHFHLVGEGYVILEDVQFRTQSSLFNPNPPNLIENVDKESQTGRSDDGWLFQGTHFQGHLEGSEVHIISTGRGDNRSNRVENDITSPGNSATQITMTFNARWVYGKPRLIAQTADHGWSYEFLIDQPTDLGSPGAANSVAADIAHPQIDYLKHSPAVPKSGEPILVTARVHSVEPIEKVQLVYVVDSPSGNEESLLRQWTRDPMLDDGQNGDAVAGDGVYSFVIDGGAFTTDGEIVAFYAEVISENGENCTAPSLGMERPAYYVVDDRTVNSELRTVRIVMSQYDEESFGNAGNTAKYDFKHPANGNYYRNSTLIMNESEVFYSCEARSAGSPWHTNDRANLHLKGKYKMPKSIAWRGIIKSTWDQDAGISDRRHNDRLTRYWLYLFGHPVNDNEFISLIINDQSPQLRDEVEAIDNTMMNRHFKDGGKAGQLFRVDDEWHFTDTWSRANRNADLDYKSPNGERAGRYHSEWMLRGRETEYDYSSLIGMFKMVTEDNYAKEQIERVVDLDLWAINFAVRGYLADWDFISLNRGKNTFFYRKPDGKQMWLHWDSDLGFQSNHLNDPFISGTGSSLRKFHRHPWFRQKFNYYLNYLIENYKSTDPRVKAWLEAEDSATGAISANFSKYESFDRSRVARAKTFLSSERDVAFKVTTNGGQAITTTENVLTLEGTGDADIFEVIVKDHPETEFEWTDLTEWRLSNLVLAEGENALQIRAIDQNGRELGSLFDPKKADINVAKTNSSLPILVIDTDPGSLNVSISQNLVIDASASWDPEDDPLTFQFEGVEQSGYKLSIDGARATIVFSEPGIYGFDITATDDQANSATARREVAVYGQDGFSNFGGDLDTFWETENAEPLTTLNRQSSYYQLDDVEGFLMIRLLGSDSRDDPFPISLPNGTHPAFFRPVPADLDWTFQSKYILATRQFGDFKAGVVVETTNGDAIERYYFGHDQGTDLVVNRMSETGSIEELRTMDWDDDRATLRVRRIGVDLRFEYRQNDLWHVFHTETIDAGAETTKAGVFASNDSPVDVRFGFDYAMLIESGMVSPLQRDLRITEIMYNPDGGQEFEFIEFFNAASQPLDLSEAYFTDGITFTFPENTDIAAGQYLILAKDPVAFANRYGDVATVLSSGYGGQLANGGETLTLVDADGLFILSINYEDGGEWPEEADGTGNSMELVDIDVALNSPQNWQASAELMGSPGRGTMPPSEDDRDGDGMLDTWETQFGFDPDDAADAFEDLDGDGWNNLDEFLAGTVPNDATSYLSLTIDRVVTDTVTLRFNALQGREYSIEYSDSLDGNSWTKVRDLQPDADGDREETAPVSEDTGYFRIAVKPAG